MVSGPPASSSRKSLKTTSYLSFRPGTPVWRVFHSGGPPSVSFPATALRSPIDFKEYFDAVSGVTLGDHAAPGEVGQPPRVRVPGLAGPRRRPAVVAPTATQGERRRCSDSG